MSINTSNTNTLSTFVLLKPDAVERGLIGKIISRFEEKGLQLQEIQCVVATRTILQVHYAEHEGKPFYENLINAFVNKKVVCMVWSGPSDIVAQVRTMVGATKPADRMAGTIRGDFSCETQRNVVHASDSDAAAAREIKLWF